MERAVRAAVRPAPQPIDLMRDRRASMREDPAWMLQIAGMTNMSSVDWPGKLTATLFLQGCPWECTYCHNPAMQDSRAPGIVGWDDVTALLDRRVGRLDGVVFSGGEPTRQRGLADAMRQAREKGFGIGLHTAGAFPGRLAMVLPLVDWVGIDIKATEGFYPQITGKGMSGRRAWESLRLVQEAGVEHEVRLTVDLTTHSRAEVLATIEQLRERGEEPILQEARAEGANPAYASALGDRRLKDVLTDADLEGLLVRR